MLRFLITLTCFPIAMMGGDDMSKKSAEMNETTVKALFVYNFTKYLEWEAIPGNKFVIGIYDQFEIAQELILSCKNKLANKLPIEIKIIKKTADVKSCHVLYIPQKHNDLFEAIKTEAAKNKVVLITEVPGMCSKGSCLNIIRKDKKLGFEINETELKQCGIKIYEQLTNLATTVY